MAERRQPVNGFAMAVVVEGGLAVAGLVLAWLFGLELRDQIPSGWPQLGAAVLRGLSVTVPMLLVFLWLVHSSRATLQQLRRQVESLIGEMFPTASMAQFAFVALLAGVGEELLFRGVLQTLIGQWTTPVFGLAITSLLFGLVHALSKLYFVMAALIGLCFGWLVFHYNDLVAPMVAHSLYDFIALLYLSQHASRAEAARGGMGRLHDVAEVDSVRQDESEKH
jgi:membrane protease YdiL (CAAX protease family)